MNISAGTVVPPALVLAVSGWSCWTIFGATATPPPAKAKPLESAAALLEPTLGAPTPRDPFALPSEPEPPPAAKGPKAKAEEGPGAKLRRAWAGVSARLAAARAAEAKRAASLAALARLPLAATSVHTERRTAMLAGRVYVEGETIQGTDPALGPVVLAEVRPQDVVLRSSAGTVAVGFADGSARTASARRPAPAAPAAKPKRSKGGLTLRGKAR